MSDTNNYPQSSGGAKIPILFGAMLALVGASIYSFYEINLLKTELAETREILAGEIGKVGETSSQTTRATEQALKAQLEEARRQAAQLAGQARVEAAKHADELQAKLSLVQEAQEAEAARVTESLEAVNKEVDAVQADANANKDRVTAVSTAVTAVKSQAEATKSELDRTIAALSSTQGDLGIQSGLIATNARELAALRERGERTYVEFKLTKSKTASRVGDFQIRLTNADPKKNRYTVEVIVDDKKVEKKDRTANEPVQFIVGRSAMPYELVVNDVKKDTITGYLSSPKVTTARN